MNGYILIPIAIAVLLSLLSVVLLASDSKQIDTQPKEEEEI